MKTEVKLFLDNEEYQGITQINLDALKHLPTSNDIVHLPEDPLVKRIVENVVHDFEQNSDFELTQRTSIYLKTI